VQEKQTNKPQTKKVEITAQTFARFESASIFLKGKISHTRIFLFAATKPSFAESGFGPFYLFRGTVGRLTCNPKAAPRPTKDQYKWYKGTTLLTSSPSYRIEYGEYSTLIIDNVEKDRDEGIYKCYAENYLGSDEATEKATVLGENVMMYRFDTKSSRYKSFRGYKLKQ